MVFWTKQGRNNRKETGGTEAMTRKFKLTTVAVTSALALGLVAAQAQAESITVVSWGGAYTKSQIKAYHEPFTAKTGITVQSEDYNGGLAEVKAQVEAGNVIWDLVDVEVSDLVRGCDEGLLETIDLSILPPSPDGTPAAEDFLDGSLYDCGVPTIVWSTIYAYDSSKFPGAKPATMADFFDTQKFPGKRAMRKGPKPNLEFALIADGVPADQVYEVLGTDEGVDRAFAKLDSVKDSMLWWEAGAQPPQMLADGEVVMATAYNGRIFNAIATGPGLGPRPLGHAEGRAEQGSGAEVHRLLDRYPAARRPGLVDLLRSGAQVFGGHDRQARRCGHRDGPAHADGTAKLQDRAAERLRVLGRPSGRAERTFQRLALQVS
jgi:spermidine/putrescine-binding protein